MYTVTIKRKYFFDDCILGDVYTGLAAPVFVSYELPWKDNAPNISCIPVGKYKCERYISESYPKERCAYHVKDVPGRKGILLHAGNTWKDTQGCILIGRGRGCLYLDGKDVMAVLSSRQAMQEFCDVLGDEEFVLSIVDGRDDMQKAIEDRVAQRKREEQKS
jgi:hypothetical protein